LPRHYPHRAGSLHRLLPERHQERRLPRLREDPPRQRARLQHPPDRPDRPQDHPRHRLALRRRQLRRPRGRGVRPRQGDPGPRPRRRVRDLALPPPGAGAGADGPGGRRFRRGRPPPQLRQHRQLPRPLQRLLGPLDGDRRPRRPDPGHRREGPGDLRGRRWGPARDHRRVARLADRRAAGPARGSGAGAGAVV
ncbi:MAG: Creatinine amidohydrolase, partial [uncultured Thermomicrobiales bacterium]